MGGQPVALDNLLDLQGRGAAQWVVLVVVTMSEDHAPRIRQIGSLVASQDSSSSLQPLDGH
ncbi:hypothetical protein PG988_006607 [Apiospora saccharicola]